jgi:predicted nucleic acid-binding protein
MLQGEIEFFISPFILEELHRVLIRRFHWEEDRAQRALRLIREVATGVDPPRSVSVIQQKDDDNRILECALQAKAQYLVSGDRRHLLPLRKFQGVSIVSPSEFLELLLRGGSAP